MAVHSHKSILLTLVLAIAITLTLRYSFAPHEFSFMRVDPSKSYQSNLTLYSAFYPLKKIDPVNLSPSWKTREAGIHRGLELDAFQNGSITYVLPDISTDGIVLLTHACPESLNVSFTISDGEGIRAHTVADHVCYGERIWDVTEYANVSDMTVQFLFTASSEGGVLAYIDVKSLDGDLLTPEITNAMTAAGYVLTALIILLISVTRGELREREFITLSLLVFTVASATTYLGDSKNLKDTSQFVAYATLVYLAAAGLRRTNQDKTRTYTTLLTVLILLVLTSTFDRSLTFISETEGGRLAWDTHEYIYGARLINLENFYTTGLREPLSLLAVKLFFFVLGDSETVIRIYGITFFLLTIWLTYRIGRAQFNPVTGLIAAWLIANQSDFLRTSANGLRLPLYAVLLLVYYHLLFVRKTARPLVTGFYVGLTCSAVILLRTESILFIPIPSRTGW